MLKWKELAKSKTELGNKINYVRDLIKQRKISEEASQDSSQKLFKPITTKLDEVVKSNLNIRMPQKRPIPLKKTEVPDYDMDIIDEIEDMNLGDLFGDYVPPQQEKQLPPPQIYVDPPDAPPKYDYNEEVDYEIPDDELTLEILNEIGLDDYSIVDEKTKDMTINEIKKYF